MRLLSCKNKTTDAEELEKLAAFLDSKLKDTTKRVRRMIQQPNCYPNTMKIELPEFFVPAAATVLTT